MEDYDDFTNEIQFSKPLYNNILNKYVKSILSTPNGPNYQSGRRLLAEECLRESNELGCAFHLSEAVSASLRTMAVYRDEQSRTTDNKLQKITSYVKPVQDLIGTEPLSDNDEKFLDVLSSNLLNVEDVFKKVKIEEELPFYKEYLKFSSLNNVENFQRILRELPKEWTIIQLTAPYNPNENLKPLAEYRTEVESLYLSVFTNDYFDNVAVGPLTVNVPANVHKEGEKPLFTELYSLLEENYKTIDNAQFLNNKRLVQNYWHKREDIDLRMKSVINVMDKEWLGGWGCLLTGKLHDVTLREKVIRLVDRTISDWGFLKLTTKQKVLLYNLIESCPVLPSTQIKLCIRAILVEHGNPEEVRKVLNSTDCNCTKDFRFLSELCLKCQAKSFEAIHKFTLVDGLKAFSQAAKEVRENEEWTSLKKAKRHPVLLIVDEMLDTFPWESLPILSQHPVSRMENIHFVYFLYKVHEKNIKDGYFCGKTDVGRFVINPEKNLDRMEKRMTSFVQYWCGDWSGHVGQPPQPADFLRHLTEADIFLYCGHGDGCYLGSGSGGAGVEGCGCRGACVLSGCGSVRLAHPPGRAPPAAAHHHLHVAQCPMVIGMLWEVTDLEVDKVVSTLVSLYVPSSARPAWPSVGKGQWSQGVLDTTGEDKTPFVPERDLLRAVSRARSSTNFVMIGSSVVARGLPVRIPGK